MTRTAGRPRVRRNRVLLALGLVIVVAFAITVRLTDDASSSQRTVAEDAVSSSSASAQSSSSATKAPPGPKGPNFPMTKLEPGQKPPQFIIFSFDGAGSHQKWQSFSNIAAQVNAQFTGFLTGLYLLTDDHKAAYTGPGHAPGKSSVGFGGTQADLYNLINDLNAAKFAGDEIGTHYNGHFCSGAEPSVGKWNTAQWNSEIDQFFSFLANYTAINGLTDAPKLEVTTADIRGGRTPCLEGKIDQLFPAMVAHGLVYDTSQTISGMVWPKLVNGVTEFYMPYVTVPALNSKVIAMDYNFWYKFNTAKDEPAKAPQFTSMVLQTYESMYAAVIAGNRAPLVIGNHFNNWSGDAFNPAVQQFMLETCRKPETVCTTYHNVMKWMSIQDPATIAALQALPATLN